MVWSAHAFSPGTKGFPGFDFLIFSSNSVIPGEALFEWNCTGIIQLASHLVISLQ